MEKREAEIVGLTNNTAEQKTKKIPYVWDGRETIKTKIATGCMTSAAKRFKKFAKLSALEKDWMIRQSNNIASHGQAKLSKKHNRARIQSVQR